MANTRPVLDRFHEKISVQSNSCWLWTGGKNKKGYGSTHADGKTVAAHRFSYTTFVRPLEEGQDALHSCDTPACVNFAHFFPGTNKQNQQDCMRKFRAGKRATLSRVDVAISSSSVASESAVRRTLQRYSIFLKCTSPDCARAQRSDRPDWIDPRIEAAA